MNEIQLLYVENIITRKKRVLQQELTFFMLVENLSHDKLCDVLWAGEDDEWHTLSASYHSNLEDNKEYWRAQITLNSHSRYITPG